MNTTRILITGGAGFIGSNAALYFSDCGYEVTVFDSLTYASDLSRIVNTSINFVKNDICALDIDWEILKAQPDVIINFAAWTHVDKSNDTHNLMRFEMSNSFGVANLLDAVRKVQRQTGKRIFFVQISTDEVLGDLDFSSIEKLTEIAPLHPNNIYAATKASGELYLHAFHNTFKDFDYIICRATNNFGPNQHWEKFIPTVVRTVLKGEDRIPIYGTGKNVREWLYVKDFVSGLEKILTYPNRNLLPKVIHFGSSTVLSNLELVKLVLETMGEPNYSIEFIKDRPGHDRKYQLDWGLAHTLLGWSPSTSLSEGLENTVRDLTQRYEKETQYTPTR